MVSYVAHNTTEHRLFEEKTGHDHITTLTT